MAVVLAFSANAQGYTAPIKYGNGVPTAAPSNNGSGYYRNNLTGTLYEWNQSAWQVLPLGFVQISGTGAPMFSPSYGQSNLAINGDPLKPKMYKYVGPGATDWLCLNCVEVLNVAEGDGILIAGTAPDITISAVDPSAANELNTSLAVSGSNLVLVDPGNTLSVPVATIAPVQNVVAGTGISVGVSGNTYTITNTSPNTDAQTLALAGRSLSISGGNSVTLPNDLQTLSLSGSNLTLSQGGGTVTLPGGADGSGIYSGSGTIAPETEATLSADSYFRFLWSAGGRAFDLNDEEGQFEFKSKDNATNFYLNNAGIGFASGGFSLNSFSAGNLEYSDFLSTPLGLTYAADYSAALVTNPRSIPDVGTVEQMLTGSGGLYSGSGDVPDATVASVGDKGAIEFGGDDPDKIALIWRDAALGISHIVSVGSAGLDFRAEYDDGSNPTQSVIFQANSSTAAFGSDKSALEFNTKGGTVLFSAPDVSLVFDDTGATPELKINDDRSVPLGVVYSNDYSGTILTNPRSLPDVGAVEQMLGSATTVTGATSAVANAAAITAGLATGDPYRWDDGTAIHLMFRK